MGLLPAVRRSTRGFFLRTVNSVQMLKLLNKGPKASETQHITQFDHDTNVGMVTFGLGGHLEAEIASKNLLEKIWMVSSSSANDF